jgi:diguanylate cyclase (GGDEF)-like protein
MLRAPLVSTTRGMRLGRRFVASWLAAIALITAVGLSGIVQLGAIYAVTKEISNDWLPRYQLLDRIAGAADMHRLLNQRQFETSNFRHLADIARKVEQNADIIASGLASLERQLASEHRHLDTIHEFRAEWQRYLDAAATATTASEIGQLPRVPIIYRDMVDPAFTTARATLNRLTSSMKSELTQFTDEAATTFRTAIAVVLMCMTLAIAATALGSHWIKVSISQPIVAVSRAMQSLTDGQPVDPFDVDARRRDEVGVLMHSVNAFRASRQRELELTLLARAERARLDAALDNMPVGLAMFDADRNLIVCNGRFEEMYGLVYDFDRAATDAGSIFAAMCTAGTLSTTEAEHVVGLLAEGDTQTISAHHLELLDGRILSVKCRRLGGGGWVTIHEDVTEQHRAEERIRHLAGHDLLTNLPNRRLFKENCTDALSRLSGSASAAIVCLDLDRFKPVNDTLGHPIGDRLLEAVAQRLTGLLQPGDIASRFGGDEFVVYLADATATPAELTARYIIESLSAPYDIAEHHITIGCSAGIALAPLHGRDVDELLRCADMALYAAKADGRATASVYDARLEAPAIARRTLETALRDALEADEFQLRYQPIVDLTRLEVTSLEALLRWRHPTRGWIPPSDFIPAAEQCGLIQQIGVWTFERAMSEANNWPAHLSLAINLSPVQFRGGALVDSVRAIIDRTGFRSNRLELEITEGLLLRQSEATMKALHDLREMGIGICMDDFGTGYSSLGYVRRFPFDSLKIDRTYVADLLEDPNAHAIVDTTIRLGSRLGMKTVAEGVERREQLVYLIAEGCTHAQGYLLSEPLASADVPAAVGRIRDRLRDLMLTSTRAA